MFDVTVDETAVGYLAVELCGKKYLSYVDVRPIICRLHNAKITQVRWMLCSLNKHGFNYHYNILRAWKDKNFNILNILLFIQYLIFIDFL